MEFLLKEINISTVHVLMERFTPVPIQDLGRHVLTSRNEDQKNRSLAQRLAGAVALDYKWATAA